MAVVVAVAHEDAALRVHRQRVRIAELLRPVAEFAPGLHVRAVGREADDPPPGAVVRVGHVDLSVGGHHHVRRLGEVGGRVAGFSGRAQRHQQLALGGELQHRMPGRGGAVPPRVGHPDVALMVHVDPVRPRDHPAAEAPQQVPLLVEEEDGIHIRAYAGVRAAALRDPDVSVERNLHRARRAPLPSVGELAPPVDGPEGVGRLRLGLK